MQVCFKVNKLNPVERLSRAEPKDWNLTRKDHVTARVEKADKDKPNRIFSRHSHLPVEVEHFRIAARLRFYPYGRGKPVVGIEIALPERTRVCQGDRR